MHKKITMNLTQHLDKLEVFVIIAETKKMSEASKLVNLTQPSLTRLVNTLEEAANTKLFIRSRSGTTLTPAGEEVYLYAKSTLNSLKDLESKLKSPLTSNTGHLNIGSYESLAEYLWPNFLKRMNQKHPKLKISIKTSQKHHHISALQNGNIDLLIDAEPRLVGENDSFPIFRDSFSFYIKSNLAKKDFSTCSIIFVPDAFDEKNKSLRMYVSESQLGKNESIELDSFTTARTFCEEGLGLAILPSRLARASVKNGLITQVGIGNFKRKFGKHTIYLTTHTRKTQDSRIQLLKKELKSYFK